MLQEIPKLLITLIISVLITSSNVYSTNQIESSILISDEHNSITKREALLLFRDMNISQRRAIFADKVKFNNLLKDLLIQKKKAYMATQQKLDDDLVQWKVNRSRNRILENVLLQKFRESIIYPENIDQLAVDYYDTHPEEFTKQETVTVAHILFPLDSKSCDPNPDKDNQLKLSKKILSDLNKDLDFSTAAKEYSSDKVSAVKGGELAPFTHGKMVKPFEIAAFNLKSAGDLSEVIETRFGFHIIKLIGHSEELLIPFEKVKIKIISQEKRKIEKSQTQAFLNQFKIDENTTIFAHEIEKTLSAVLKEFPTK